MPAEKDNKSTWLQWQSGLKGRLEGHGFKSHGAVRDFFQFYEQDQLLPRAETAVDPVVRVAAKLCLLPGTVFTPLLPGTVLRDVALITPPTLRVLQFLSLVYSKDSDSKHGLHPCQAVLNQNELSMHHQLSAVLHGENGLTIFRPFTDLSWPQFSLTVSNSNLQP